MKDKWNGGSGDWLTDPSGWSSGAAPSAKDTALIGVAGSFVTLDGATTVAGITISSKTATLDIEDASGIDVVTGAFVNAGTLEIDDSVGLKVKGDFTNTGALDVDARYARGGSALTISGTLDNTNSVNVGNSGLDASETITLGGLTNTARASFAVEGVNGRDVAFSFSPGGPGFQDNAGSFSLEYTSALTLGNDFKNSGGFYLENASSLTVEGGFFNSGDVEVQNNTDLVIGADFTNKGTFSLDSTYGHGGGGATITGSLVNTKLVRIGNSGLDVVESVDLGGLSNGPGATCTLQGSANDKLQLNFDGSDAGITSNSGTLTLFDISGFVSKSSLKNGGIISLGDDGSVTLGDVVRSENMEVHDDTSLDIQGDHNNFGTFDFDNSYGNSGGSLAISGTLTSRKLVRIGNSDLQSLESVTIGALSNTSIGNIYFFGGTLLASVTGASKNDGTIWVEAGATLNLDGRTTGGGVVEISGGTLNFNGVSSQNVSFSGLGGLLEMADSEAYTGTVSAFARNGSTALDLTDIQYIPGVTTAIFTENQQHTGGVLAVSNGVQTSDINMAGINYPPFTVNDDGHGGAIVTCGTGDIAEAPSMRMAASVFASAMAGFGAKSAGDGYHTPENLSSLRTLLARPLA